MKLTPIAKLFITVVILGVIGYTAYYYRGADVREWATGKAPGQTSTAPTGVTADDFNALRNAPPDPARNAGARTRANATRKPPESWCRPTPSWASRWTPTRTTWR